MAASIELSEAEILAEEQSRDTNHMDEIIVNWYPGHMVSALRMMTEQLKVCDVIIYMLDARCAMSCLNPNFDSMVMRKPVLFVLNKSDLAPAGVKQEFLSTPAVQKIYKQKPGQVETITLNSGQTGEGKKAVSAVMRILSERLETARNKGITKTIRAIVIGVTNCGKSTFINNLAKKGKTVTGDKPGVTKQKQWVTAGDNFNILDTPGTLWPQGTNQIVLRNLAYVGSIKDDILDAVLLTKTLIRDLEILQPGLVTARYGSSNFEEICKKRGYLLKGGILDIERCAKAILVEFRAGSIGKYNLDKLGKI